MTHYTTVFFDLYGTLIDIHTEEDPDAAWTALRAALYQNGADYATNTQLRNEFRRWYGARQRDAYAYGMVRAGLPARLPRSARGMLGRRQSGPCAEGGVGVPACRHDSSACAGVFDMLTQLRSAGLRVALVSNAQSCYTRPELELTGLGDVFDEVVISSDEGVRKPSAELFRSALVRMNVEPEHVVMVGNDPRNDIDGARMANIDGIYLHTDNHTSAQCDTAVCSLEGSDYAGVLAYIQRANTEDGRERECSDTLEEKLR